VDLGVLTVDKAVPDSAEAEKKLLFLPGQQRCELSTKSWRRGHHSGRHRALVQKIDDHITYLMMRIDPDKETPHKDEAASQAYLREQPR
jgi:hypothetical protein